LSRPALGALALFTFQATWNDFTWPLIVMTKLDRIISGVDYTGSLSDDALTNDCSAVGSKLADPEGSAVARLFCAARDIVDCGA
jgi:hypothetical protein